MHLRCCLSIMNVAAIVLLLLGASKLEAQATSAAPNVFHLLETTIDDVLAALRSGRLTCRELVELYLKRIAAYDKSGPGRRPVNPGLSTRKLAGEAACFILLESCGGSRLLSIKSRSHHGQVVRWGR